jgi:hypothetical protein
MLGHLPRTTCHGPQHNEFGNASFRFTSLASVTQKVWHGLIQPCFRATATQFVGLTETSQRRGSLANA